MLKRDKKIQQDQEYGQTAVEYLLLLGVVVAIVMVGMRTYLPRTQNASEVYWNRIAIGILGDAPPCGDGFCCTGEDSFNCPNDCEASANSSGCTVVPVVVN